jgi:hypothetical protein
MKMEQTVFQNVGIQNSEAGELPRRKHTTFTTSESLKSRIIHTLIGNKDIPVSIGMKNVL